MDAGDVGEYAFCARFSELRGGPATPRVFTSSARRGFPPGGDEHLPRSTEHRHSALNGTLNPKAWHQALVPSIILELKFADRYPVWMRELSRSWDLYRVAMCKYLHCTEQMSQTSRLSQGVSHERLVSIGSHAGPADGNGRAGAGADVC
jgi:hypothetical protein